MKTFIELQQSLLNNNEENINSFLEHDNNGSETGHRTESVTRLFGGLELVNKLSDYTLCKGNFNKKTIEPIKSKRDIYYDNNNNEINIRGNGGNSSDITMVSKNNPKHLLVISSKVKQHTLIGDLDIEKMSLYAKSYEEDGYKISYGFIVKNKNEIDAMILRSHSSSSELVEYYNRNDTVVLDWNDINEAYHRLKIVYGNKSLNDIINSKKDALLLKLHQTLSVFKTLRMKECGIKKILWGHIQRSGKSYIIAGCIIDDSKDKNECNYIIMSTSPNETMNQQRKLFDYLQFEGFNVITLNGKNKKPKLGKKNIILCSKQFLQGKIEKGHDKQRYSKDVTHSIGWLKGINFDMRFIDESHNGGTTELAKKTLDFYGKNAFTVYLTATYSKPVNDYNIPKENWILWDLQDIKFCKNIDKEGNNERLVEKHGKEIKNIIKTLSIDNIIKEYSKYPELFPLTNEINPEVVSQIINDTRDNDYGWSTEACFLLKQSIEKDENGKDKFVTLDEFQNETENLKLWYRIFGKKKEGNLGIPNKEYPDEIVFMKRIEKICKNPTINSRFIGEGDYQNEPMIILAFLPVFTDRGPGYLSQMSNAIIKLLTKNKVIEEKDYDIITINDNGKGLQDIEEARVKARNSKKKGVLVLSGTKCGLGVSIDNCDIVLLLNNTMSIDRTQQMMYRSMTEGNNKKCGFVVDLNIQRNIEVLINYASLIKPNMHPKEAIKYLLNEKIINLNCDHWMPCFGNNNSKINTICDNVYDIYSSQLNNVLDNTLKRINLKNELFSKDSFDVLNSIFKNSKLSSKNKQDLYNKIENELNSLQKGIEKKKVEKNNNNNNENENENENENSDNNNNNNINPFDILKPVSIIVSLLTIKDKSLTKLCDMMQSIATDTYKKSILKSQIKIWWGSHIKDNEIDKLLKIFVEYMNNDKETEQLIRTIKEMFCKNINNSNELSKVIDKYLIPEELEKKNNGEVSTPFKLRQEMLSKLPLEFWKSIRKVFEPCSGKGGFLLDIIKHFMDGLKDIIPDEKVRYKTIVEDCLYFSDINSTNIFICKLLIDPHNEYKLNYNEGNTLELNIKEKWDIAGFDAIIGNPPFQAVSETGVSKGGGNNLYTKFIYWANDNLINNGFILFINPPTYFGPGRSNNKNEMSLRKNILDNYYYYCINLEECAKHFKVGSKFVYYLIQKCSNKNKNVNVVCKYNNIVYKTTLNQELLIRDYLPYLLTNECLTILNKIKNNSNIKLNIFHSPDNRSDKKHILKKTKKESENEYKIRAEKNGFVYPMQATSVQVVYSLKKCKNQNDKKVLMSRSGYLKPFYDNGVIGIGGDCFACLVKDESEANKIIKLLSSNLYKFYIETNKWSGFHNKEVLQDLPNIINAIDVIDNDSIYKYFNLTNEEIKLIENSI